MGACLRNKMHPEVREVRRREGTSRNVCQEGKMTEIKSDKSRHFQSWSAGDEWTGKKKRREKKTKGRERNKSERMITGGKYLKLIHSPNCTFNCIYPLLSRGN